MENTTTHSKPKTRIADLNGEERTQALYYFFGWQGGTVHQLAKATGLTVHDILHAPEIENHNDQSRGWFSVRTCDREWRREVLAPKRQGNLAYWQGVMVGYWATGALAA